MSSKSIRCRLERINKSGYNSSGLYFGVPHVDCNGELQRIYLVGDPTKSIVSEYIRAGSRKQAIAQYAERYRSHY